MAISRKGNRIIKPTQDIFLFAWRKETNKCCVMKLFARFFNDTSYTHHKTIFNQCIIFSRPSRNGVWLDVKIMRKNAGFRARIYYLYNKIG